MNPSDKVENIERVAHSHDLETTEKLINIKRILLIGENRSKEEVLSSIFMVVAGIFLIIFMVAMEAVYYETQEIGNWKMRAILALAGGAMAVGFTGNINIKFHWVQASGSLAVVLLFYFVNPISNIREETTITNIVSNTSQDLVSQNSFFISKAYSEGELEHSGGELPVDNKGYNYKIVYPIGVGELKDESINIGERIKSEQKHDEIKVYSVGSVLKAPINAIKYDKKYDVSIRYNRLVDPDDVSSIKSTIESELNTENQNLEIITQEGYSKDADVVIEFKSK